MRDERTYKIIGAAIEVQSADYADFHRLEKSILSFEFLILNEGEKNKL